MKKIILGILVIGLIIVNQSILDNYGDFGDEFAMSSLLKVAIADTENNVPCGTYPNCACLGAQWPSSGGSWSKGIRQEDRYTVTEYFKLEYGSYVSIGFFKNKALAEISAGGTVKVGTTTKVSVAYNCDGQNDSCCQQVNRYMI
ncbi:MAG: hypothetical protein FD181_3735 [Prolixibacteraceae bacterium]|nr:MAG: hypothetical protein FD181_3735 [Prolixibacteraceae bacterium]